MRVDWKRIDKLAAVSAELMFLKYWDNSTGPKLYFIQEEARGAFKIGISNDPPTRLVALQTGNPRLLRMIGFRGDAVEHIHSDRDCRMLFEDEHIRGDDGISDRVRGGSRAAGVAGSSGGGVQGNEA